MSLTPTDFLEQLQQDKLGAAAPTTLVGMAKKSEGEERSFQFAPGGNCSKWVTIPLEFVEEVEVMRTVPCKDHSHPLVKLHLKAPRTPEGKVLFAILEGMQTAKPGRQHSVPMRRSTVSRLRSGFGPRPNVIESGCHKRCYPSVCPNPDGPGTIWCTECWEECIDVPEFGSSGFLE